MTLKEAELAIQKLHDDLLYCADFDDHLLGAETIQFFLSAIDTLKVSQRMMALADIKEQQKVAKNFGDIYK